MNVHPDPIRVLIVEDSTVARELLVALFQSTPGFQVVGAARSGVEAIKLAKRLKPSVITMDVFMPEMDGFEATRHIMSVAPCPIVVISGGVDADEGKLSFDAIQAGALTVLRKPSMDDPPEVLQLLTDQIKLMAEVKVVRRTNRSVLPQTRPLEIPRNPRREPIQLVAMAASTGGPAALAEVLSRLPEYFPVPILIVQHITPGFGQGFAAWLNQQTPLRVRLAYPADSPVAGEVLIAPDNYHMEVNSLRFIMLRNTPPDQSGQRPSANYLFHSVARAYGATAIGVILSGMGGDGADGLRAMRETGAHTIAQDEATCVVFGMPAVAIAMGAAQQVLPINKIAAALTTLTLVQEA